MTDTIDNMVSVHDLMVIIGDKEVSRIVEKTKNTCLAKQIAALQARIAELEKNESKRENHSGNI